MPHRLAQPSRRDLLAAGLAAALLPHAALAEAPETARPPRRRPGPAAAPAPAAPTAEAGLDPRLSGEAGFALADLATGTILAAAEPDRGFVPASVAKVPTALYALDRLGEGHRFATRLLATGPIRGGTLAGDLVLQGGGDPELDTDGLLLLLRRATEAGLARVTGRFLVDGGALPHVPAIDPTQPVQVAYNPSVAGLNLNFNRVYLEWKGAAGKREIVLEARALHASPRVSRIRIAAAARATPVFTWEARGGDELWTVSEPALGREGGRWLPVRDPIAYAGDVFRALAAAAGVTLPVPEPGRAAPGATELARHLGAPLPEVLRSMLKHSTNLTAEAVGLAASAAAGMPPGADLALSGAAMTDWMRGFAGIAGPMRFANHSGLSAETEITPRQMVTLLAAAERNAPGRLRALMKPVAVEAAKGERPFAGAVDAAAKTGTLNFVRSLSGYLTGPNGRPLAFAIFAGDLAARSRDLQVDDERPEGSRAWLGRARAQERRLLADWARRFGAA